MLHPVPVPQRLLLELQVRLVLDLLWRQFRSPQVQVLRVSHHLVLLWFGM